MNRKTRNRWLRHVLSVALIASLALLMLSGVAAASSISGLTFSMDSRAGGATTNWTVQFTTSATGSLGPADAIYVNAPVFSTLPTDPSKYTVNGVAVNSVTVSGGTLAQITPPTSIGASTPVTVVIAGVTNPPPSTYSGGALQVWTNRDNSTTVSPSGNISFTGSVSGVSFSPRSLTGGATANWTVGFTTSNGGPLGSSDTITVTAPSGTGFPAAASAYRVNGTTATTVSASGNTATITVPAGATIFGGVPVSVMVTGVTNPAAGAYANTAFAVHTSMDTPDVNPTSGKTFTTPAATAVSGVSFTPSSLTGGATANWTVGFTTGTFLPTFGSTTITITAPSGTSFPASASAYRVNGNTATTVNVLAPGNSAAITVTVPIGWGAGTPVTVTVAGVTNPSGGTYPASAFSVLTSQDTLVVSPAAGITFAAPAPPPPPVTITAPAARLYTNNPQYTFKGNAMFGATVTVAVDGTTAGTVKLDASSGQWSFTPAAPLADGQHTVTASGSGYTTGAIPFTVKTKPPVLTVGAMPGGGITNQNKPTVTGTTESGATVALSLYTNTSAVATLTPDSSGNWSYTFPTALPDASYSLTFTATDLAGNTTTVTKGLKIKTSLPTVAITPPAGPASVNQPVVAGTAEANSSVALYVGGGWAATATADSSGAWSVTLPGLLDGQYWLTASALDAAGNVGWAKGVALQVATAAQPVTITAPASGSATNQAKPAIAGTAKPGSTVAITLDGKQAATVTATNAGQWQYSLAAPLADGSHTVSAAVTDPSGTASTAGPVAFTVKTSVPAITLTLPSGNLTTPLTPGGSAEAGSTVQVYLDGTLAATVQPDASGAWTASIPAADGSHTVSATALDAAGNAGKAPALTVPVVPAVTISTPDGAHFTTAQPALAGTAQPSSTVAVILDGTPWGNVTATVGGRWAYRPAVLADGSHTVSATATDAQGVTGTSSTHHFTVNTTPVALSDIAGNPAETAITSLVEQGIFTGFPDGTFRPGDGVTRAQLAVVYAKALGLQPQPAAALTFNDRSEIGDWAAPYVAAMLQQGLLKGYPDGSFRPNATISRAELASLLARVLQQRGIHVQAAAPVISDTLPAWAADAIRTVAAAQLLSPGADGAFASASPATRSQTAQAFYLLITLLQGR